MSNLNKSKNPKLNNKPNWLKRGVITLATAGAITLAFYSNDIFKDNDKKPNPKEIADSLAKREMLKRFEELGGISDNFLYNVGPDGMVTKAIKDGNSASGLINYIVSDFDKLKMMDESWFRKNEIGMINMNKGTKFFFIGAVGFPDRSQYPVYITDKNGIAVLSPGEKNSQTLADGKPIITKEFKGGAVSLDAIKQCGPNVFWDIALHEIYHIKLMEKITKNMIIDDYLLANLDEVFAHAVSFRTSASLGSYEFVDYSMSIIVKNCLVYQLWNKNKDISDDLFVQHLMDKASKNHGDAQIIKEGLYARSFYNVFGDRFKFENNLFTETKVTSILKKLSNQDKKKFIEEYERLIWFTYKKIRSSLLQ